MSAMSVVEPGPAQESSAPAGALAVVTFVLCFALFVGGLVVMSLGYDASSALLFTAGLVVSSLAFLLPLQLLPESG